MAAATISGLNLHKLWDMAFCVAKQTSFQIWPVQLFCDERLKSIGDTGLCAR